MRPKVFNMVPGKKWREGKGKTFLLVALTKKTCSHSWCQTRKPSDRFPRRSKGKIETYVEIVIRSSMKQGFQGRYIPMKSGRSTIHSLEMTRFTKLEQWESEGCLLNNSRESIKHFFHGHSSQTKDTNNSPEGESKKWTRKSLISGRKWENVFERRRERLLMNSSSPSPSLDSSLAIWTFLFYVTQTFSFFFPPRNLRRSPQPFLAPHR